MRNTFDTLALRGSCSRSSSVARESPRHRLGQRSSRLAASSSQRRHAAREPNHFSACPYSRGIVGLTFDLRDVQPGQPAGRSGTGGSGHPRRRGPAAGREVEAPRRAPRVTATIPARFMPPPAPSPGRGLRRAARLSDEYGKDSARARRDRSGLTHGVEQAHQPDGHEVDCGREAHRPQVMRNTFDTLAAPGMSPASAWWHATVIATIPGFTHRGSRLSLGQRLRRAGRRRLLGVPATARYRLARRSTCGSVTWEADAQ